MPARGPNVRFLHRVCLVPFGDHQGKLVCIEPSRRHKIFGENLARVDGCNRSCTRAVRDHPSVSRWQRSCRTTAHYISPDGQWRPEQTRALYYELLQGIREHGDWESWLAFFFRGVSEVSAQAAETARGILAQREAARSTIAAALGRAAGNGHRVLEHLYERPIVSVNAVQRLLGVTYPAANQIVERLERIGILREVTGQARNRRFRYDSYINLFDSNHALS
jgi:hypothetical protein